MPSEAVLSDFYRPCFRVPVAGREWQEMTGRGAGGRFVFVEPGQDATVADFKPGRDCPGVRPHRGPGVR